MRTPTGGQSSHKPGDDRIVAPCQWHDVPEQLVMAFAVDLCTRYTYRGAAKAVKLAPETVRKFVYRIGTPNLATRRRFAELYLEMNAEAIVAVQPTDKGWKARPPLTDLLRPSERRARNDIAKIFDLARRFPGEAPKCLDRVQEWLDLQVRGEYWASNYYGAIARGERAHDSRSFVADHPKRPRKPRRISDPAPETAASRETPPIVDDALPDPVMAAEATIAIAPEERAVAVESPAAEVGANESTGVEASDRPARLDFTSTLMQLNRLAVAEIRAARSQARTGKPSRPGKRPKRGRRQMAGKPK